jgi:hypothetical protein
MNDKAERYLLKTDNSRPDPKFAQICQIVGIDETGHLGDI